MKKLVAVALCAVVSLPALAVDRNAKFDLDGDNKLSFTEVKAACPQAKQGLFNVADKNKDGVLDVREARSAKDYLFKKCKK